MLQGGASRNRALCDMSPHKRRNGEGPKSAHSAAHSNTRLNLWPLLSPNAACVTLETHDLYFPQFPQFPHFLWWRINR